MKNVAAYSNRSLSEKLGIKEGTRVRIMNPPANYSHSLGILPHGVILSDERERSIDLIQFFAVKEHDLRRRFPSLKKKLSQSGALWIAWPKRSSNFSTDLNENLVRDIGLWYEMVDVKVCALNKDWSALKFVYRVKDRKEPKAK